MEGRWVYLLGPTSVISRQEGQERRIPYQFFVGIPCKAQLQVGHHHQQGHHRAAGYILTNIIAGLP